MKEMDSWNIQMKRHLEVYSVSALYELKAFVLYDIWASKAYECLMDP